MKWKFDPQDTSFTQHVKFFSEEDALEDYKIVPKPYEISDSAIRKGTYSVRRKGYYEVYEYYPKKDWWIYRGKIEAGYWTLTEWNLIPSLPNKEWLKIGSCYNYLSNNWKVKYYAWKFWIELRELRRDTKKFFLRK